MVLIFLSLGAKSLMRSSMVFFPAYKKILHQSKVQLVDHKSDAPMVQPVCRSAQPVAKTTHTCY